MCSEVSELHLKLSPALQLVMACDLGSEQKLHVCKFPPISLLCASASTPHTPSSMYKLVLLPACHKGSGNGTHCAEETEE